MKAAGTVVKMKKGAKTAFVNICRPDSCIGCANAGICQKKDVDILAVNEIGAKEGDRVEIDTRNDLMSVGMLCYIFLVPVAILFIGIGLFYVLPWLTLACIPLIAAYVVILKIAEKRFKPKAVIIKIKEDEEENEKK